MAQGGIEARADGFDGEIGGLGGFARRQFLGAEGGNILGGEMLKVQLRALPEMGKEAFDHMGVAFVRARAFGLALARHPFAEPSLGGVELQRFARGALDEVADDPAGGGFGEGAAPGVFLGFHEGEENLHGGIAGFLLGADLDAFAASLGVAGDKVGTAGAALEGRHGS